VVAAVLAVVVAGAGATALAVSHRAAARSAAAPSGSAYSRLAGQLKHQLPALAPALATAVKRAESPRAQRPAHQTLRRLRPATPPQRRLQPIYGYACAVAMRSCSLHPCVEYAQSAVATPVAPAAAVSPAPTAACRNKANAPSRLIPVRIG
jgi:hypothetical protein